MTKSQLNLRISGITERQIAELQHKLGVSKTELITIAIDRMAREESDMATGKFYIEVDSYWQNSESVFIGPFDTEQAAQEAADKSEAVPHGRYAQDVENNVRYEIRNTTSARKVGMNDSNTVPASWEVPNDTRELKEIKEQLARY